MPLLPLTVILKGLRVVAESWLTVSVLFCPVVIEEGSKEQVVPDEHESATLLRNELGADTNTVKVAEVVPMTSTVDLVLEEREKTALPVPLSATACGLPAASSLIAKLPVRLPLAVGVNVILTVQPSPTLRTFGKLPQSLVCEKSPEMLMAETVTAICPVFVRRTT